MEKQPCADRKDGWEKPQYNTAFHKCLFLKVHEQLLSGVATQQVFMMVGHQTQQPLGRKEYGMKHGRIVEEGAVAFREP